jgi:hypothetical protein
MVAAAHDARPTQRKSIRRRCDLLRNPPRFMNDQLVDAPTFENPAQHEGPWITVRDHMIVVRDWRHSLYLI